MTIRPGQPNRHFLTLQTWIGLTVILTERIFWWEPVVARFPTVYFHADTIQGAALLLILLLNVSFIFNSAIWSVFGNGKRSVRFMLPFVLYQCVLMLLILLVTIRRDSGDWQDDQIALWAAASGMYLIFWVILVCLLRMLRFFGYRLVYEPPAAMSRIDLSQAGADIPPEFPVSETRERFVMQSNPFSITDLLWLTTWIAIVLAAAIKVYHFFYIDVDLQREGIFGKDFPFILTAICLAIVSGMSLLTMIPSAILGMVNSQRPSKNIVLQTCLFLHAMGWIVVLNRIRFFDEELWPLALFGLFLFGLFQLTVVWCAWRPLSWFHFRLTKRLGS